jgi:regulatory protein
MAKARARSRSRSTASRSSTENPGGVRRRQAPTPLDVAARILARAPRTEAELEARLVGIGYQPVTAATTVERCRELGYVGDEMYARERARTLRARGCGELRIAADLGARGLPDALVAVAIDESREGLTEKDLARRALGRLGDDLSEPATRARAWRLLAGRGFAEEVVTDVLGEPE